MRWSGPSQLAGGGVIADELSRRCDNHDAIDDDRRAREAPHRDLGGALRRHVAGPHERAGSCVEDVQDARGAKRIDAAVADSRCAAGAGATIRLPEPYWIAVPP